MDLLQTTKNLLQEFGQQHDLEIVPDDDGACLISTEHGLDIILALDEPGACLRAMVTLSEEPEPEHKAALYSALLNANLFGAITKGGHLAVNPESGQVLFQHAYALENSNPQDFAVFFAKVSEAAGGLREACRQTIESLLAAGSGTQTTNPAGVYHA
jgi:hypothetical protein